jgi:hypothetical protein
VLGELHLLISRQQQTVNLDTSISGTLGTLATHSSPTFDTVLLSGWVCRSP